MNSALNIKSEAAREWFASSMYSAVVFDPNYCDLANTLTTQIELFSYGRSQTLPLSNKFATQIHTNIARSGHVGLPKDWEFICVGWRARVNHELGHPCLREFFSNSYLQLVYNDRYVASYGAPLLDVIDKAEPRQIKIPEAEDLVIKAKHGSAEWHTMESRLDMHSVHFREYLSYHVKLDFPSMAAGKALADYMPKSDNPYPLILWVYLDGLMKQTIY